MKKIKFLMVIIIFVMSFFSHFIYNWFPNFITSIFFPVNESIWEHMKIIYTSILLSSIIEYFIYKVQKISVNNFWINIPIVSIIGIIVYLIIYLLIDNVIPHNLFVSISLLFIIYILTQFISYNILKSKSIPYEKIIGIIAIVLIYIVFTYLTYFPIKSYLFLDTQTNTYGINPT